MTPTTARLSPEHEAPLDDEDLGMMLMIRHFEQALLDLYGQGQLSGTVHTCLGQEYVPVSLAPLLTDDFVFSNHRGHGHYLALHNDPTGLLAEILGREGGVCGGVGGSQHIYRAGEFLSTGVQGESLPVAVGVALHLRRAQPGQLAVTFIGDGTFGEGGVYEALNMANLWRVPLLVVVEHNGIAQSTPTTAAMAGTIAGRAQAFGAAHIRVTGNDVAAIRAAVGDPISRTRHDGVPLILEFDTVRLGPHSKGDDTRGPDELRRLREHDWASRYAQRHPEQFRRVDRAQQDRIAEVVADVLRRPLADGGETLGK